MYGGFGMGLGWIFMVLFAVFVIVAVIYFVRYLSTREEIKDGRDEDAVEILKRRFARGEIDRSEYEERMKLLGKD